jgi:GMP synthase-like glutamine amidotransferase
MDVLVLQHIACEPPGAFEDVLVAAGADIHRVELDEGDALPPWQDFVAIVAMGGPMSVNDEAEHRWLIAEKRLVREAIDKGRAVVGVCLGAQVIASALGGRVYRNTAREIGWFPVSATPAPASVSLRWPDELTVFHWHGETFDLPSGAVRLASSEGCLNQAFQIGDRVVGLQFHLEATPATVAAMVEHCRHELTPDRYVQSEQDLLATSPQRYLRPNRLMDDVLMAVVRAVQPAAAVSGPADLRGT